MEAWLPPVTDKRARRGPCQKRAGRLMGRERPPEAPRGRPASEPILPRPGAVREERELRRGAATAPEQTMPGERPPADGATSAGREAPPGRPGGLARSVGQPEPGSRAGATSEAAAWGRGAEEEVLRELDRAPGAAPAALPEAEPVLGEAHPEPEAPPIFRVPEAADFPGRDRTVGAEPREDRPEGCGAGPVRSTAPLSEAEASGGAAADFVEPRAAIAAAASADTEAEGDSAEAEASTEAEEVVGSFG